MITNTIPRRVLLAAFLAGGLLAACLGQAANTIVTGYLSGTNNWSSRTHTIYQMNGMVFVRRATGCSTSRPGP